MFFISIFFDVLFIYSEIFILYDTMQISVLNKSEKCNFECTCSRPNPMIEWEHEREKPPKELNTSILSYSLFFIFFSFTFLFASFLLYFCFQFFCFNIKFNQQKENILRFYSVFYSIVIFIVCYYEISNYHQPISFLS